MIKKYSFLSIILGLMIITSCGRNKFDVDVSNIEIELNVKRLDKDLIAGYPDTPDVLLLTNKYENFLELYSQYIIQAGPVSHQAFAARLHDFNNYCFNHQLPSKVDQIFGDFSSLKNELTKSFKYYHHYFPEKEIPVIYTFLSNFSISVVIDHGLIGIGLDKYLGGNYELYRNLGIDNYKISKMHKEMIAVDCMRAIAESEFPYNDSMHNLLSRMVYEGKIQYFLDAMLPFAPDSLKFGYSEQQFEWADYNEREMWAYIVEQKLLFGTDELTIRKMVADGPFTTLFANNSAPRAGAFLGWKIVRKYMDKNPGISLQDLMKNNDYRGILNKAAYKP